MSKKLENCEATETVEASEIIEASETTEAPDNDGGIGFDSSFIWLGAFAAIGIALLITAIIALVKQPSGKKTKSGPIKLQIGKLHRLGDRESQQDCFAVSPEELYAERGVLAVVADGMGGLSDGDKVSGETVTAMLDGFFASNEEPSELLVSLLTSANSRVNALLGRNIGKSGSTVVAGIVKNSKFHYISVGDSRICLFRNGELIQLNREHIYKNELLADAVSGVGTINSAIHHPRASGLTSFIGMGKIKYVDIPAAPIEVLRGDKFILMSDGVYNAVSEEELKSAISDTAEKSAEKLADMIAKKVHPHQDNYTAVIISAV